MDNKTTNERCCPMCGEPYTGHVQIASGATVPSYRCGRYATKAETPVCDRIVRLETDLARIRAEVEALPSWVDNADVLRRHDVLAVIGGEQGEAPTEVATLEGKIARMQPVVDIAVKLRECRAALDHAASQGKSQDFMGQLRERYGWTGRELDRVVDEFGVLDGMMSEYLATRGGDDDDA